MTMKGLSTEKLIDSYSFLGPRLMDLPSAFETFSHRKVLYPNICPIFLRPGINLSASDLAELEYFYNQHLRGPFSAERPYFCTLESSGYDTTTIDSVCAAAGWRRIRNHFLDEIYICCFDRTTPSRHLEDGYSFDEGDLKNTRVGLRLKEMGVVFGMDPDGDFAANLRQIELSHSGKAHCFFVKNSCGDDIATGSVCLTDSSAFLVSGVVKPHFENRGLWRVILNMRLKWAFDHGADLAVYNSVNKKIRQKGQVNVKMNVYCPI